MNNLIIDPSSDFSFIADRLAIGSVASRSTPGFVAVVSLLSGNPFDEKYKAPPVPSHWTDKEGIRHSVATYHIDIADGAPGLRDHLSAVTAFMAEHIAEGCVLVHCGAGMSRSVAVVAAYLCRYAGMSLQEAVAFIRERRQGACPADIFIAAITRWLRLDRLAVQGPRRGISSGWVEVNES